MKMPAELTSRSRRPKDLAQAANARPTSSGRATSPWQNSHLRPIEAMTVGVGGPSSSRRDSSWRSKRIPSQPSSANSTAIALPMPELAPVTRATRSRRRMALPGRVEGNMNRSVPTVHEELHRPLCVGKGKRVRDHILDRVAPTVDDLRRELRIVSLTEPTDDFDLLEDDPIDVQSGRLAPARPSQDEAPEGTKRRNTDRDHAFGTGALDGEVKASTL